MGDICITTFYSVLATKSLALITFRVYFSTTKFDPLNDNFHINSVDNL